VGFGAGVAAARSGRSAVTPEEWRAVKDLFAEAQELSPPERVGFLDRVCFGNPERRRQVESLLASADGSWSLLDEPPAAFAAAALPEDADTRIGQRVGAYEIVSEIGRGGMGSVYLARRADGQFEQTVALKLIKRGMDTDAVLARFRYEREILARLHHPYIAQLYDGGATEQGVPYFAMEHVEGEPLFEYCERRGSSVLDRLSLFRSVCSAVHYAHRNLIVHRDIKPSNIVVTKDGTPKLLDFGIAKVLDPDTSGGASERTATALRAMTPDYASPEQIRGEPVTTATDVYSLGVVLYELLTGRRPYRVRTGEPEEMARVVCQQEPERPGTAVRELKGDIENIVLMAMRKEPERRYASAEQMAEDIRLHLEGRPILARKDTAGYRMGKFVRRHRVAVFAAAVTVLSLAGGLVLALTQAHRASLAEARSQRRFNDVRKLAGSFLFEFHDAIENLPGSTPARALVVKRALEYLDGLAREGGGDPALRRELATAYEKVGEVQGGLHTSLGDTQGAIRSYGKAVAIREEVARADPKNLNTQMELASSYRALAHAQKVVGRANASETLDKAIRIWQELALSHPAEAQVQSSLGIAYWERAQGLVARADYQGAVELQRKATAVAEGLLRSEPGNRRYQYNLSLYQKNLGALLEKLGDPAAGLELYRKAIALDQARVAAEPNDSSARLDLSFGYGGLGFCLRAQRDFVGARSSYAKALAIREALAAADPKNVRLQEAVAYAHLMIGNVNLEAGNPAAALAESQKALTIRETVSRIDPSNARSQGLVAIALVRIGAAQSATASSPQPSIDARTTFWREARGAYQRGGNILLALKREGRLPAEFTGDLDDAVRGMAQCDAEIAKGEGSRAAR
jgi:tetratricopeptide (TPR) repeat protein